MKQITYLKFSYTTHLNVSILEFVCIQLKISSLKCSYYCTCHRASSLLHIFYRHRPLCASQHAEIRPFFFWTSSVKTTLRRMRAFKVRILIGAPTLQNSQGEIRFKMTNWVEKKVGGSHSERQKNWECAANGNLKMQSLMHFYYTNLWKKKKRTIRGKFPNYADTHILSKVQKQIAINMEAQQHIYLLN